MIDEASNRTTRSVDYHILIEHHEVVALGLLSITPVSMGKMSYLSIAVLVHHPSFALILSNDLSSVLDNNLVWLECPTGDYAESLLIGLDYVDTDVVLSARLASFFEIRKRSIAAEPGIKMFCFRVFLFLKSLDITVVAVTFVKHVFVLTVIVTSRLKSTETHRSGELLVFPPLGRRFTNKSVFIKLGVDDRV